MLSEDSRYDDPNLRRPLGLPEGTEHGTLAAVRLGCACKECMEKRARMRRHRNGLVGRRGA